jgi:hypothetical protein
MAGKATCECGKLPLIEIDAYGERLRGRVGCNQWQAIQGGGAAERAMMVGFAMCPIPAYDQSQRGMGLIGFETGNQSDAIPPNSVTPGAKTSMRISSSHRQSSLSFDMPMRPLPVAP